MSDSDNEEYKDRCFSMILQQLRSLRETGIVLEPTMTFDDILSILVEQTTRFMDAERSVLYLIDQNHYLVSRVIDGESLRETRLKPGQGVAGWVARYDRPLCLADAPSDARFDAIWDDAAGFQTHSVLCHPIRGKNGKIIGVVEVLNRPDSRPFDDTDLDRLGVLAAELAVTIDNARLMVGLVGKNRGLIESKGSRTAQ